MSFGGGTGAVFVDPGGNDSGLLEMVIEDDDTGVETTIGVGKVEVVDGRAGEFGFHEILQVIAKESKTTAKREWEIDIVEKFVTGKQVLELIPGIAEKSRYSTIGRREFAARAVGTEGEKRIEDEK